MIVSVLQRNPRYTVASGLGLLVVLLLLASQHESFPHMGPPPGEGRPDWFRAGAQSTPAKLADAEKDYAVAVARRNALIREMGPDPSKIDACVTLAGSDDAT